LPRLPFVVVELAQGDRLAGTLARLAAEVRARFGWRRVLLALAICAVVSTQALFQPSLYAPPFLIEGVLWAWADYLGECLLMGLSVFAAASLAETLVRDWPRWPAAAAVLGAIVAGAFAGALLVVPYYDLETEAILDARFVADVVFWTLIGAGVALIHSIQRRTAAAAAAVHQAQVQQIALSKQALEAQLQVMRAQIEPHFLFNTLANVKRLAQTDPVAGLAMLDNLARYLRVALPRLRDERASLGQEADLVQAYLEVLQIRMGDRLRFRVDVPPALREAPFPPVMLLTLVENAVKHGLDPAPGGGAIDVRAERRGDGFAVHVADTGVGFAQAASHGTGVGLSNTRARLAAIYGEHAALELAVNEPSGVVATIAISGRPVGAEAPAALEPGR
jgi:hypothetical protein